MSDIKRVESAQSTAAGRCMRSLGFQDWKADLVAAPPDAYKESDLLNYLDPAKARESGYPQTVVDHTIASSKKAAATKLSRDAIGAFLGSEKRTAAGLAVPTGGCSGAGERQVKKSVMKLPADARFLAAEAQFAARRDTRMQRAFAMWSTCMAQNGLHYTDPLTAQIAPQWAQRKTATPAGVQEKLVAATDAACRQKINLVGTYKALEIAYQRQYLATSRASLIKAKKDFSGWLANAKVILASK